MSAPGSDGLHVQSDPGGSGSAERWRFLARVSEQLSASLDAEEILRTLARAVVPAMADWCSADMLQDDGSLRRLAMVHADPASEALARKTSVYPADPEGRHPRSRVLRSGKPFLAREITPEGLAGITRDPEQLRLLQSFGYRSAIIVPLQARGQMLGVLTLATAESQRRYGEADLSLAEELARRAAMAVDNARLLREAQEASRLKDEFLATVSHELRTPLQAMLGWVAVLRMGGLAPERQAHAFDVVERAGRTQARLIDDLLDISRMVTGGLRMQAHPVDLAEVVSDTLESVRPAATAKRVHVEPLRNGSPALVVGDPVRLQQIVWNLLSNAIKFTPAGGTVCVQVVCEASDVRLVVTDTGQGIQPEFFPHLFEPFRQSQSSRSRVYGGLGLGLAIVRRLVELHGGRVEARSEGGGRGAQFAAIFPSAARVLDAALLTETERSDPPS